MEDTKTLADIVPSEMADKIVALSELIAGSTIQQIEVAAVDSGTLLAEAHGIVDGRVITTTIGGVMTDAAATTLAKALAAVSYNCGYGKSEMERLLSIVVQYLPIRMSAEHDKIVQAFGVREGAAGETAAAETAAAETAARAAETSATSATEVGNSEAGDSFSANTAVH